MKLNWGTGIWLFYLGFVVIMVSMVIFSSKNNIDLEQENYYEKDLNYESFRLARENSRKPAYQVDINFNRKAEIIELTFPGNEKNVTGTATMFRPSDSEMDRKYPVQIDSSGRMLIPTRDLDSGLWKLRIDWNLEDIPVFTEKVINI